MLRIPRHLPSLALAVVLALGVGAHAESVRVPGSGVRMTPPPGFSRAEQFAGFQDPEHGASIVVTEIPGPFSEVRRGMTREGLASRGAILLESSAILVGGEEALLLHASQRAQGVDYFKWMLVGGSAGRTVMIVGTFPADATELSDPIRHSLVSASWGEPRRDLFEGLPFRVDPLPAMRLAERMGDMLILTESGRIAPGNPGMAVLIVGSALSDASVEDLARYSKERLLQTDRLTRVRIHGGSSVVIDSLSGYEVIAEGADAKNGRAVSTYQLLLSDGTTYYIAQGFVTPARFPKILPVFRRVTGSFRRVTVEERRPTITQ